MRLSEKGRTVIMELGFWMNDDGTIHLTGNDPEVETFHVAIRQDPAKNSGHPYLYRELAKCLKQMGAKMPDLPESSN
jgi:hypothetical protein